MAKSSPIPHKDQSQWANIFNESGYSMDWLKNETKIDTVTLNKYIFNSRTPRKLNKVKMEKAMSKMSKGERKLERHPSYGYATPEQIELLNSMKIGSDRDYLLGIINKQNKSGGKVVFDIPENFKRKVKEEKGELI